MENKEYLEKLKKDKNILNIYTYGSAVYGLRNEKSDIDYIVVVNEKDKEMEEVGIFDFHYYSKKEWKDLADRNNIAFIECVFLDDKFKIKETYIPDYKISIEKIRREFSHEASNSFVKCKKKLTVEKDYNPYIGKKSLFHSLRILMFGIFLLNNGYLKYDIANKYYKDIVLSENNDWLYFKNLYQPEYNKLKSEFRKFDRLI